MIDGHTRLYAVIGDPVAQLKTPELINPIFHERGEGIVAVPFHIASTDLPAAWATLRKLQNLAGIGVAIPHKGSASTLCDQLDRIAEALGVVSAVRREADGTMRGAALDGPGFLAGLEADDIDVRNKCVLLIGAGGAATAIAMSLAMAGVKSIAVTNRNMRRASALVSIVNKRAGRSVAVAGGLDPVGCDIMINATSLGLHEDDDLPIAVESLNAKQLVIDVIANPPETRLLQLAKAAGIRTHSGVNMINAHMKLVADFLCK